MFVDYADAASALAAAAPPLMVIVLSLFKGTGDVISSLDILNSAMLRRSVLVIPFLTFVHQSLANPEVVKFSTVPIITVSSMTLLLMHMYYNNRAHKHGSLLVSEMKSEAIFAGVAILMSCVIVQGNPNTSLIVLASFLLGSMFTLLMSFMFGATADVWFAVGTGQWQMVSLDTFGLMVYFVCPAVVLYLRFLAKYGKLMASYSSSGKDMLQSAGLLNTGGLDGKEMLPLSMVMSLAAITAVGVPIFNSLCPLGGYLFCRAYTHGQPNTKKVAICIYFAELPKDGVKVINLCRELSKRNAMINILVTLEELTMFPSELKLIAQKGHTLVLAPSNYDERYRGLGILRSGRTSCNLQISHHDYEAMLGEAPKWMLAKSSDSRHPSILHEARNLGLKVIYWSTISSDKQIIFEDCQDKNGGSIVLVQSSFAGDGLWPLLAEVLDSLDGFTVESLNSVVKDDAEMKLEESDTSQPRHEGE